MHLCDSLLVNDRWTKRMFDVAELVGSWSKDTSTQVGAVIAKGNYIVSAGYNGFPAGVDDDAVSRHERPRKYLFSEHAERNAIYSAHRHGASVEDCTIYVPFFPCADCSRAIIAERMAAVVTYDLRDADPGFLLRWKDSIEASLEMFQESGVRVSFYAHKKYKSFEDPFKLLSLLPKC